VSAFSRKPSIHLVFSHAASTSDQTIATTRKSTFKVRHYLRLFAQLARANRWHQGLGRCFQAVDQSWKRYAELAESVRIDENHCITVNKYLARQPESRHYRLVLQLESSFSFVHAADLHLGSPCSGLTIRDEEVAARFAAASRKAFEALVTKAIDTAVGFVVIAGDVYDGDWKDNSIGLFFNHQIARFHREKIPVLLLKGNHDAESVVTKTITLPDSVLQFPSQAAATFKLENIRVALHGRSFAHRSATENYALSYPAPIPGWFNIGVLHTSCTGRAGHADYAPCKISDLASRQYQYWALGMRTRSSPRIHGSSTPATFRRDTFASAAQKGPFSSRRRMRRSMVSAA
jgi:hypothetical protein